MFACDFAGAAVGSCDAAFRNFNYLGINQFGLGGRQGGLEKRGIGRLREAFTIGNQIGKANGQAASQNEHP